MKFDRRLEVEGWSRGSVTALIVGVISATVIGHVVTKRVEADKEADKKRQIEEMMTKSAYLVPDLNQNSIADFVIERNDGHKYLLFGIQEGDTLIYLPASEMEQRQKDAVKKVDYERIEDLLNKQ